jgi:glycosyltransferase involved in cell wall biosynthesis
MAERESMRKTDVSFSTTVYNNMPWVRRSLLSLIETSRILKNVHNLNCEIVAVDNFSDDGTFEEISKTKYEVKDVPINIVRRRCTRGMGRHIATLRSKGSILVYVDMDTIYDTEFFSSLIASYIRHPFLSTMALYITLVRRDFALKIGNFQDLNRTEDVEFCARLAESKLVLPLIDPATFSPYDIASTLEKEHAKMHQYKNPSSQLFVETYGSERRYSTNFLGYLRREFNNKIDMIRGLGLTPSKIVREQWFLRKTRGAVFFISVYYHLAFWFITLLTRKEIFAHSKYLSNSLFGDLTMVINYVELLKNAVRLGLLEKRVATNFIAKALATEKVLSMLTYVSRLDRFKN